MVAARNQKEIGKMPKRVLHKSDSAKPIEPEAKGTATSSPKFNRPRAHKIFAML
jgi:hypothetical protein